MKKFMPWTSRNSYISNSCNLNPMPPNTIRQSKRFGSKVLAQNRWLVKFNSFRKVFDVSKVSNFGLKVFSLHCRIFNNMVDDFRLKPTCHHKSFGSSNFGRSPSLRLSFPLKSFHSKSWMDKFWKRNADTLKLNGFCHTVSDLFPNVTVSDVS